MMRTFLQGFVIGVFFAVMTDPSAMAQEMMEDTAGMDDQAMMQMMAERTEPGEAHEVLENLEGEWTYSAKFWMSPESEAEETTGTSDHSIIYDGRFIHQEVTGSWMGEPFEGTGITGYDNIRGEYVSIWYDNMMTGIGVTTGQYNPATETLTLSGTHSCPLTGETHRKGRSEYIFTDAGHLMYNAYGWTPDGQEFKMMEIRYSRVS